MAADQRPIDIRESGLLWLINTSVLHPRGFALGWSGDGHFLLGDGSEPWRFELPDEVADDLFRKAQATLTPTPPVA